jgi:hypothetical protein
MNVERILEQLKAERAHLDRAIDALSSVTSSGAGRGRGTRRRHKISAAGRRRISLAMKRRWATRRKAKKAA